MSIDENCAKRDGLRRFRSKTGGPLNGIAFNGEPKASKRTRTDTYGLPLYEVADEIAFVERLTIKRVYCEIGLC